MLNDLDVCYDNIFQNHYVLYWVMLIVNCLDLNQSIYYELFQGSLMKVINIMEMS